MYQPPGQGERFQYSCSRRPHMRSRSFSHHLQRQIEMPEAIHTELGNRTYSGRQTNYESNSQYGRTSGRGFRMLRNQGFEPRRAARPWGGGDSSYSERGPLQPSTRYDVGQDVDRSQHNNNRNGWMDNPRGRSHTRGARGRLRERVKGGRQWGQRETFDIRQRREINVDDFVSITDTTLLTETLLTRLTELEEFMNSPSVSQENTVKLLKVLTKVTDCEEQRESVLQILRVVCASRFLDIHLVLLLLNLTTNVDVADSSGESIIDIVEMVCTLFSDICSRLPSYSAKCSLTLTAILTQPQMTSLLGNRPDLAQDLKTLTLECERCMAVSRSSHEQQDSGERKRDKPNDDDDMPPENFEYLSIFPNSSDLDWTEKPFLRPNKIGGAFKSRANYLDVQFRLLREDYIRPLRNGIKLYRETLETGKSMEKNFDIRLYHGVRVVGLVCGDTMEHLLHFDVTRLLKVRWQSSKRLIYGSLLCLSKNDFETNYFAVVTKREVRYLRKGIIQVRFESRLGEIVDVSPSEQFVMAETVTFFEAYRHVLEGLKEMRYGFSMSRYLVECQTQVKPPRYLMSYGGFRGMDLQSLLKTGSKFDASAVSVINPRTWPPLEETIFNSFQLEAVRTALTKELAIIQGPPGTGKTYVGLKVAEVLLRNDHLFSGPILVVCYTNHALDQFLEGIMRFCDNIVRVGSRCKNPELKRFNLKEIRAQIRRRERDHIVSQEVRSDLYFSHQSISLLSDEIRQLFKSLSRASDNILTERTLNSFMPTTHYQSLVNKVIRYQETHLNDVMMDWLTLGTVSKREEGRNINEYDSLAREVKLLILNGKSTCSDEEVDAGMVSSLPAMVRARLYRFWLTKVISHLQDQAREATQEGQDPDGIMELLDEANNEILPDHLLKPMMKEDLYNSISTLTENSHYSIYTIRSWLGLNKEWQGDTLELELLEDSSSKTQGEDQEFQEFVDGARPHFQPPGKDMGGSESPEGRDTFKMTSSTPVGIDHNTGLINSKKEKQAFFREERTRPRSSKRDSLMRDLSAILQTISTKDETNDDNVEEVADVLQRERMLDDDDDDDDYDNDDYYGGLSFNYQGRFARKKHFLFPPSERICQSESLVDVADDEWTPPRPQKKKQVRELQYLLKSATPMTEEEANNIKDVWDIRLKVEDKVRLYLFWVKKYRQRLMNEISFSAEILSDQSKQLTELKFRRDAEILRTASVVGMTTTGAARCRKVLAALRCPVVILEEAAEVLEAHVVTTLHSTCQHVILIGDHQQLRPSPTVFELCRDYNLDVSLFERLINNDLPHTTLAVQHRMRPEIGRLMRHIYPNLLDHEDTTTRPNIRGVKHNVFFFQHEAEETNDGETSSKSNQHEAEICLALCRYFMKQGYEPSTITILAAYTGQVLAFKKLIDSHGTFFKDVRVTAIDNYQGEENDIIILSLVRNNDDGSVGFLKTDNRVCVALSRARNGLYAFGNFRMLAEKSELWKKIVSTATQHGQLGVELTIRCENHLDKQIKVTSAEDFNNAPEGGCMLRCSARLQCGHTCELICHGHDRDHEHYVCKKKCARILCKEQHVCPKSCFENCGDCMKVVDKTLPWCFHTVQLPCSADIWTWLCTEPCNETFPCGHMCVGRCGLCREQSAHVCQEKVERTLPCGHVIETLCCNDVNNLECTAPCQEKLDCGHECVGTCGQCLRGRAHVTCGATCNKRLEGCGHKCPLPCGSRCLPCKRNFWFSCKHQTHMQPCCDVSQAACPFPCPWKCHHKSCSSQCPNPCFPCPRPCQKKLECGHKCRGYCKECCVCFQCDRGRFVDLLMPNQPHLNAYTRLIKLPRCEHVFLADTLDVYVDSKLSTMSGAGVLRCPACSEPVGAGDCWRFHHRLRLLQTRGEEGRKKLTRETTLSPGRLSKIERSLGMLSLDAKQKGHFGFVVPLPYFENWINVNLAFALTNQIKLVKVTETIVELLKDFQTQDDSFTALGEALEVARSTSSLQNILLQPANVMSGQRCRELTREVRRLAYLAMLCCAMCICQNDSASDLEPLKRQINACLDTLKDRKQADVCSRTEIEAVFRMCDARLSDLWKFTAKLARQLSILDEPADVDLCDIAT